MADLQTVGARVLSLWRNEDISSYRKRPRDYPGQLAKPMIDIESGEDTEAPTSAKPYGQFARSLQRRNRGGGPLSEAGNLLVRNNAKPHGAS